MTTKATIVGYERFMHYDSNKAQKEVYRGGLDERGHIDEFSNISETTTKKQLD